GINLRGLMSHLACGDIPSHPLNRQQAETFTQICQALDPTLPRSLLNSAGMVSMPDLMMDVVRPGLALYGIEPIPERPIGLKPVMSMTAKVIQIRQLQAGDAISYGASFVAKETMRIAVVSAGYADGIPRQLSNRACAIYNKERLPITGRVCMDYTMLDVTHSAIQEGDWVAFWGEQLKANEVASVIDSISYTLFTGLGTRVQRLTTGSD
ncbi:MAG: alanine racemase, partial [Mariprofundus sp.]|nr:alanine racemase [Mariprofundus sp.]